MKSYPENTIELAHYLGGYPEYEIPNRYGNTPTDPELALEPMLERMQKDATFLEKLHKAMVLLSQDQRYGWMVMYYISNLAWQERLLGQKFLTNEVISIIGKSLLANKTPLEKETRFHGLEFQNGVWTDVLRMNQNIREEYDITVIPESDL